MKEIKYWLKIFSRIKLCNSKVIKLNPFLIIATNSKDKNYCKKNRTNNSVVLIVLTVRLRDNIQLVRLMCIWLNRIIWPTQRSLNSFKLKSSVRQIGIATPTFIRVTQVAPNNMTSIISITLATSKKSIETG